VQALTISKGRPEKHLQSIVNNTKGILFLGTPHRGADAARLAEIIARVVGALRSTNTQALRVLQPDSEVLERLQDSFNAIIRERAQHDPIEITCFYEELPMAVIGIVSFH